MPTSRGCTPSSTRYGLVVWTGGNVSGRVPGADLFVIKPSGVSYDELAPENMILCDLDGNVVAGTPGASAARRRDTAAHAYVYRNMPEVGGVVHTHSTYATAWAARGEEIPCVITAMADEFGGPIPVGPFAIIGDDSIGRGIVETLTGHRSPCGADAEPRPVHDRRDARRMRSRPPSWSRTSPAPCTSPARPARWSPIPQEAIDSLYDRYQNVYGAGRRDERRLDTTTTQLHMTTCRIPAIHRHRRAGRGGWHGRGRLRLSPRQ